LPSRRVEEKQAIVRNRHHMGPAAGETAEIAIRHDDSIGGHMGHCGIAGRRVEEEQAIADNRYHMGPARRETGERAVLGEAPSVVNVAYGGGALWGIEEQHAIAIEWDDLSPPPQGGLADPATW